MSVPLGPAADYGVYIPVLCAHRLDTRTDANIDHPSLDGVRHIDARLQPARALAVQRVHRCLDREPGYQAGSSELGRAATGRKDGADVNVFDDTRVDSGALDQSTEDAGEEVLRWCVLEAATATLGERGSERAGYYHIVRVLLRELVSRRETAGGKLLGDLGKAGRG